jgi:hypothetical protein
MAIEVEPMIQAALGGFMLNMMNIYQDSKRPKNQRVIKDGIYWTLFLFWPLAGAALAYIYMSSGYDIKGWLAFTTGLTAPTALQTIIDKGVSAGRKTVAISGDVEED